MIRTLLILSTFLSAFLLFLVQPLFAKWLLPYFGGTSSVWTISIFFYSTTLLLGYLYASLLTSWPSERARLIHSTLLVLAGALLIGRWVVDGSPILVPAVVGYDPVVAVLLTLLLAVGLPVLLLASTSVLAQYLYARLTTEDPYPLYAVSNLGSLLGLAAYPFLLEPFTVVPSQAAWWAIVFVAFLLVLIASWRQVDRVNDAAARAKVSALTGALDHRGSILLMAAIPTFLLASTTEFLSKGIASFPLLWVIPLMLYLTSFIVSFRSNSLTVSGIPFGFWALLASVPTFVVLPFLNLNAIVYWAGFVSVMTFFFLVCIYYHNRIYELRPRVNDLGAFYVWLTLGGAIGSGVVGMILPLVLDRQIEVYLAFGLISLYLVLRYLDWLRNRLSTFMVRSLQAFILFTCFAFTGSLLVVNDSVASERNFYGTLHVLDVSLTVNGEEIPVRGIVNGATNHGLQALDERYESSAASYYGPDSGIDVAVRSFTEAGEPPRVQVVGLGAGMMNAYCDEVEHIDYIEINPAVEAVAREYFTYLEMCPEKTTVTIGDGRLVLEDEVAAGDVEYDVIMMDAFTDDAIPAHLLTTEAFTEAYQPLLSERGVIAFHISNKYLNLYPPIVGLAEANGYEALVVQNDPGDENELHLPTSWVLVTQPENADRLLAYASVERYQGESLLWRDDRNSVISVLSVNGSRIQSGLDMVNDTPNDSIESNPETEMK